MILLMSDRMTMRAMVLDRITSIEEAPLTLRPVELPSPGPGEVRVKVRCCAVCRTDLHIIEGDLPMGPMPMIPGHQIVGEVEACGQGASRFQIGNRIGIAWLRATDGQCVYCQRGRENLCENAQYTGYHADGGYAGYATVPESYAYALPERFDDAQAAPLLCAGLIGYRALERANVPAGGRVLLVGFGSSAHIVLQLALHRGHTVDVLTRSASHQQLAKQMGASHVGDDITALPAAVDSAIHFAPAGDLVPPILEALRPGGALAIAGIHLSPIPSIDYDHQLYYEKDLRSVTANTRADGRALLAEAAAANVQPHITEYALDDANRALADMKASRLDGTAVLRIG